MICECERCGSKLAPSIMQYDSLCNCAVCSLVFDKDTGVLIAHKTLKLREDIAVDAKEYVTAEFFTLQT